MPKASLPLDIDTGAERESRNKSQGWPDCTVAQPLPICVFLATRSLLDIVVFVFK